jgi:hypothetical protein
MNEAHYPTYPAPWHGPAGDPPAHPPRVSPEAAIALLEARIVLLEVTVRRLERAASLANLPWGPAIAKAPV